MQLLLFSAQTRRLFFSRTKYLFLLGTIFLFAPCSHASSQLVTFIDNVLENNPAIHAAHASVLAAAAQHKAASLPLYNPEFAIEYQSAIEKTFTVGINQTIDWTNKKSAKGAIGAANRCVAEAQLAHLRQQLSIQTLDALAKYHTAKRVVRLAQRRSDLLNQFVGVTHKRYKSGDIARVDLDLAQLAFSEALALQATAETSANQALQTLRAVTGSTQMNWPNLPSRLPRLNFKAIYPEHFSSSLPAIEVLNHQYDAAIAKIKLAQRESYPDPIIGVQGGNQRETTKKENLYGVSLTVPLFILNPHHAEIDAANFDAMEIAHKREAIFRQAKAEILSTAERYLFLYRALQRWHSLSGKALNDGVILIRKLWQAGEINTTDYLVQLRQRVDSQIAGVELQGKTWEAWIEWLKATGQAERWLHQCELISNKNAPPIYKRK